MARFRDTLWFKKGHLDAKQAEQAAGDAEAIPAVDLMHIEDRYIDDGSVDAADSFTFGVRTGATTALEKIRLSMSIPKLETDTLVREMKRGRVRVMAALGVTALALAVLLIAL